MECPLDEKRCYKKDPHTSDSREDRQIECRHGLSWALSRCPAQVRYGIRFEKLRRDDE